VYHTHTHQVRGTCRALGIPTRLRSHRCAVDSLRLPLIIRLFFTLLYPGCALLAATTRRHTHRGRQSAPRCGRPRRDTRTLCKESLRFRLPLPHRPKCTLPMRSVRRGGPAHMPTACPWLAPSSGADKARTNTHKSAIRAHPWQNLSAPPAARARNSRSRRRAVSPQRRARPVDAIARPIDARARASRCCLHGRRVVGRSHTGKGPARRGARRVRRW